MTFDSGQLAVTDRTEVVRDMINTTVVRVNLEFNDGGLADLRAVAADMGRLAVGAIRSNTLHIERTAKHVRDEMAPSVFVGLQPSGNTVVAQGGNEAVLSRGNLVLFESTTPYTLHSETGFGEDYFRIPLAELALPRDAVRRVSALSLAPGDPLSDLTALYLRRVATRPEYFDRPRADAVAAPTIELIRALIAVHLDAAKVGKEALHASLQLRILEYTRAHIRDADLSAARIASAHHISVRHLYKVLAAGGVSLGDWIRVRRLEGCRADLANPAFRFLTIAAIARRWGLVDAKNFSRVFRAAYGMSPREWRAVNQPSTRMPSTAR